MQTRIRQMDNANIPFLYDIPEELRPKSNCRSFFDKDDIVPLICNYKGMDKKRAKQYSEGQKVIMEVDGESMTNNTKHSIPHGCLVAGYEIKLIPEAIPLNRPMLIEMVTLERCERLIKVVTKIDIKGQQIQCESLNPSPTYKPFFIPFYRITGLFEVTEIVKQ